MKLLDTDTCIAILRGNEAVMERRVETRDEVVTTWITAAELFYGAAKSNAPAHNHTMVTSFLATLPVLGLDGPAVQVFGTTTRPECATRSVSTRRSFRSSIPVSSPAISQPGWSTGPGSDRSGDSGRL